MRALAPYLLIAALSSIGPALAEDSLDKHSCARIDVALRFVLHKYNEVPIATAWDAFSGHIIITASDDSYTIWGLKGSTLCMLTVGENWKPASPELKAIAPPGTPL